ncbi:STAS domain-containing protein [Actinoplanes flavus]|uniref:STAS domain-containing protein n=1 Tax=Actinoplanes flavus TaxID=2820290 RepID=A0ABS3UGT7_9ACTN|nr:STAS domain-containing protein [Actinoplanes flavus]MBO3736907.1 STAS domain-containing protein [Actinoplanes flavus]
MYDDEFRIDPAVTVSVHRLRSGDVLARVVGELDSPSAPMLLRELRAAIGDDVPLLRLDLAGVAFCDQAGLRALHALSAEAGPGRVRIVAAHGCVDVLLRLCGIDVFLGWTAGATTRTG